MRHQGLSIEFPGDSCEGLRHTGNKVPGETNCKTTCGILSPPVDTLPLLPEIVAATTSRPAAHNLENRLQVYLKTNAANPVDSFWNFAAPFCGVVVFIPSYAARQNATFTDCQQEKQRVPLNGFCFPLRP